MNRKKKNQKNTKKKYKTKKFDFNIKQNKKMKT